VEKGSIVVKTEIKALFNNLIKKVIIILFMFILCILCNKVKNNIADKYNLSDSIFSNSDPFGTVLMILVYIVLGMLFILLIIALFKFFSLFYELKRVTVIDFVREKIVIQSYDFPFEKQIEEKRFNRIVGVNILQKSIDRTVNSGTVFIEYLVSSKNDSKLRAIEIPNVTNPIKLKEKLLID
jgi:hypothetical protein